MVEKGWKPRPRREHPRKNLKTVKESEYDALRRDHAGATSDEERARIMKRIKELEKGLKKPRGKKRK